MDGQICPTGPIKMGLAQDLHKLLILQALENFVAL